MEELPPFLEREENGNELYNENNLFTTQIMNNNLCGLVTLTSGNATVFTKRVRKNSNIILCVKSQGGLPGNLSVATKLPGASFSIASTSSLDASTVSWTILDLIQTS